MIVYQVTNLINNKRYFCVTCRTLNYAIYSHRAKAKAIERRMKLKPTSKMSKSPFHGALMRYGEHNFNFRVIDTFSDVNDAYAYKELLIKEFNTTNPKNGYNCTTGGLESFKMTTESINRMVIASTGKTMPESFVKLMKERIGILHPTFGLKHSKEIRERMSLAQLNSDYVQSEESKKRTSDTMKERWRNPTEKMLKDLYNRKHHIGSRDTRGKKNPMYGKGMKGKDNPMYGKKPWNKGVPMTEQLKKKLQRGREKYQTKKRKELLKIYSQRTEKKCNFCKEVTPLDMFYKSNTNLDGYAGRCISCERQRTKQRTKRRNHD